MSHTSDVLIIGCGIAGATTALRAARNRRRRVTVLTTTDDPLESSTSRAQGGIVAAYPEDDTLVGDIVRASAGTSRVDSAQLLASEGGALLQQILIDDVGVHFDLGDDGEPQLGREGGHSIRRILHVGDRTGRMIALALLSALRREPNVRLVTRATALDLIVDERKPDGAPRARRRCLGVLVLESDGSVAEYRSTATVLATGGVGRLFENTTNPPSARGDGLAMAARAGARIADAEFVQFHPTALALPGAASFLVSEAVRGEGAVLLTPDGDPFMERYSPEWKDLAPRDIVSWAIHDQMRRHDYPYVLLDIASHQPAATIRSRFPVIYQTCLALGLDITVDPIPVRPAAHYFCGGIAVDARSRSSLDGLYAVGEVSNTGLHGANRLASTSLLEGLVWAAHAANDIEGRMADGSLPPEHTHVAAPPVGTGESITWSDLAPMKEELRALMWNDVGIVRTTAGLKRAIDRLRAMDRIVEKRYRAQRPDEDIVELRNMIDAALQIARAAARRKVSVGCHRVEG